MHKTTTKSSKKNKSETFITLLMFVHACVRLWVCVSLRAGEDQYIHTLPTQLAVALSLSRSLVLSFALSLSFFRSLALSLSALIEEQQMLPLALFPFLSSLPLSPFPLLFFSLLLFLLFLLFSLSLSLCAY